MTLRPAQPEDLEKTLALRNDPASIPYFKRKRALTPEEYFQEWGSAFENSDPYRRAMMICEPPETIGALLFELAENRREAEVSIYVDQSHHGKGIGQEALRQGCAHAFQQYSLERITAIIHPENESSIKAFEYAGFKQFDKDARFLHYVLRRKR